MEKKIICPSCCFKFHPNDAVFLFGKKYVVPDMEDLSFNTPEFEAHGFVQRIFVTNAKGVRQELDKRCCPNCKFVLPTGYGMRKTLLISILGDARSGKSVFLTMLINQLENNPDFPSKLTFIGDNKVREYFYNTYQKPLLKDHTLVSSTKRKRIPPYAFNYWYRYRDESGDYKENSIDIIFYDIAGEDLRDHDGIRNNGYNIKDSSGLIYLVDPTNFNKLADLFRFSDQALVDAIPADNSNQAIFDNLYNFFIGFDSGQSEIPLALTISKADLFKFVNFDFFNNKPSNRLQNVLPDEKHHGAVYMPSVKGLHQEVRELISYIGEDGVYNNALGCFKHVQCFAVSSLGKKPIVEQISDPDTNETIEKGYVDGGLEPFRVKEPFYWILMRNGLLLKHENNRYTDFDQVATPEGKLLAFWKRVLGVLNNKFRA